MIRRLIRQPEEIPRAPAPGPPAAHPLLSLQRSAGNGAVAAALLQRAPATERTKSMSQRVTQQADAGRFVEPPQTMGPGEAGPPQDGGAFWFLNGLNPPDLCNVLQEVGARVRGVLLAHIADTVGRFDTPRLTAALRAESWGEHTAGLAAIELLDYTRGGSYPAVWGLLAGKHRPEVTAILRVLPRETVTNLQSHLADAPEGQRQLFTDVAADLLGTGTDMRADDVIDVAALRGLDRLMAGIYNQRGRLLFERATALGINTASAAGIMKVESGGETFSDRTDLSIMRFENHILWNRWGSGHATSFNQHFDFDRRRGEGMHNHRFRDSPTGAWTEFHGNQASERAALTFATGLAGDVAYECASFGAGQIMGFNHTTVGFPTAREMAEAYDRSERRQVTGIFEYITGAHLQDAIRRGDYEAVARGYNGVGQVDTYARLMREAAEAYARVTAGKRNVIP